MRHPKSGVESETLIRGPVPLYYQIANILRNSIFEGGWQSNSQLPTESRLAHKYRVSRPTIRKAKDILLNEGLICSIKGSGCYVNSQKSWKKPPPTVNNINDILHLGSNTAFKIQECGIISSTDEINQKLQIPKDRFVFQIKGVRLLWDQPISYVTYYIPHHYGLKIPLESINENPLIPQIEKMIGIKIVEGIQSISLGRADKEVAEHIDLKEGDAVITVKTVYFGEDNQPVEYLITNYREKLPYSIRVSR